MTLKPHSGVETAGEGETGMGPWPRQFPARVSAPSALAWFEGTVDALQLTYAFALSKPTPGSSPTPSSLLVPSQRGELYSQTKTLVFFLPLVSTPLSSAFPCFVTLLIIARQEFRSWSG